MSHKDGRVVLSAWVDPVLRDHAREAARLSGLTFSRWVERAVTRCSSRGGSREGVYRCTCGAAVCSVCAWTVVSKIGSFAPPITAEQCRPCAGRGR